MRITVPPKMVEDEIDGQDPITGEPTRVVVEKWIEQDVEDKAYAINNRTDALAYTIHVIN